jgi:hypothetical protein
MPLILTVSVSDVAAVADWNSINAAKKNKDFFIAIHIIYIYGDKGTNKKQHATTKNKFV